MPATAAPIGAENSTITQAVPSNTSSLVTPAAASATPTVGTPVAAPSMIVVNTSTPVIVAVQITDPTLIPGSVNLLLLGATGTQPTILGVMQSAGNGTYIIQPVFNETSTGQIQLQVSAAFRGKLQRVLSNVVNISPWGVLVDTVSGFSTLYPPGVYNLSTGSSGSFSLQSSPQGYPSVEWDPKMVPLRLQPVLP